MAALESPSEAEGIRLLPPGDPYLQPNRPLLPPRGAPERLFRPWRARALREGVWPGSGGSGSRGERRRSPSSGSAASPAIEHEARVALRGPPRQARRENGRLGLAATSTRVPRSDDSISSLPVHQLRALAHARQAEVARVRGRQRRLAVEAVAVVGHAQLDLAAAERERQLDAAASAWRPAFTTASWAIRNRSPAISGESSIARSRAAPRTRSGAARRGGSSRSRC